ncbi:hypothetical protein [Jannaschia sp. R86511]|uniref:hypothetical protein n=1 Tax=Jannaschia sp. R86511 TaxID=3093853 RepID=UPI0036D39D4C
MTDGGRLRLGLLLAHDLAPERAARLADRLPDVLAARFGVTGWDVSVVREPPVSPAPDARALVDLGRTRLLEHDWDLAVVLTDLPLRLDRRPVTAHASPLHGVGLLSVPALGAVQVARRTQDAVVGLVEALLGGDDDREDLAERVRELQGDDDVARSGGTVALAARVLVGNLRLLLGMVRANRPWRLALRLSRTLSAAAAAGVLALITPDVWLLADAYGPVRLALLAVASVVVTAVALVAGAGLWERHGGRGSRRQVALFNLATSLTVLIGVTALHLALLVVSLVGAFALVVPDVLADAVGHDVGPLDLVRLAWFTTILSTVAGALGAGLESDEAVREAAYTYRAGAVPSEPQGARPGSAAEDPTDGPARG